MTLLKIILISLGSILAGSAVFCLIMGGPSYLAASPIVSLFALVYALPTAVAVGISSIVYRASSGSLRARLLLYFCLGMAGGAFMFVFGIRDQTVHPWIQANVLGGCLGALVGAYFITKMKRYAS